jgi:hypothetical protein
MAFRWQYNPQTQQFTKGFLPIDNVIVEAANKAVQQSASAGVQAGRADIAQAGFSKIWQNSLRYKMMTPKNSLNPKAYIHTRINYADIFETGGTIQGDPLIWLPLPSVPPNPGSGLKFGGVVKREHMTPGQYVRKIGPLISLRRPGKPPILAAAIRRGFKAQPFGRFATKAQLRRGLKGRGGGVQMIPLFVGVPSVHISKKWNVTAALQREANNMPKYYEEELRKLDAKRAAAGVRG